MLLHIPVLTDRLAVPADSLDTYYYVERERVVKYHKLLRELPQFSFLKPFFLSSPLTFTTLMTENGGDLYLYL